MNISQNKGILHFFSAGGSSLKLDRLYLL